MTSVHGFPQPFAQTRGSPSCGCPKDSKDTAVVGDSRCSSQSLRQLGQKTPPVCIRTEGAPGHQCCDSRFLTAPLPDLNRPPTQQRSRCEGLPLKWFSPFLKGETQISQKCVPDSPPAAPRCLWAVTRQPPGSEGRRPPPRMSGADGAGLSILLGPLPWWLRQ